MNDAMNGNFVEVILECGRNMSADFGGNAYGGCGACEDSTSNQTSATCCY